MVKTGLRISQPLGGTTSPFLLLQQGIFVRRPRCPCLSQTFVCSCQYRATTQKKYSARHKRDLRGARQHQESASPKRSPIKKKNDHPLVRGRARLMQLPGFEPGLSRPQREVLTTIRQLPSMPEGLVRYRRAPYRWATGMHIREWRSATSWLTLGPGPGPCGVEQM